MEKFDDLFDPNEDLEAPLSVGTVPPRGGRVSMRRQILFAAQIAFFIGVSFYSGYGAGRRAFQDEVRLGIYVENSTMRDQLESSELVRKARGLTAWNRGGDR